MHDAYGHAHGRSSYDLLSEEFVDADLGHYLNDDFRSEYLDRYTLRAPKPRMPLYHLVGALDPGGWEGIMKRNHDLVLEGRRIIAAVAGTAPPAPDEMIGSMASVILPDATGAPVRGDQSALMDRLAEGGFSVIVAIWPEWPSQLIRLSAHLYNEVDDYVALAEVLRRSLPD